MKEKKKFELSASEISLILYALSVVIVVVAYFAVFNPKMTEAKDIEAQNIGLQTTVSGLESMVAREAEVIAETAAYRQEVQDIIAKYPVDVPTEKVIKIVQDMQDINGVDVSDFSVQPGNLVGSVSNVTVTDINASAAAEGTEEGGEAQAAAPAATGVGYYTLVNVSYKAAYDSFKDMVWYMAGLEDRTTIPVISASVDSETGLIKGSVSYRMYYLSGTGKTYKAPELEPQDTGVTNIFGNIVDAKESALKDGDDNNTEESGETETNTEE